MLFGFDQVLQWQGISSGLGSISAGLGCKRLNDFQETLTRRVVKYSWSNLLNDKA